MSTASLWNIAMAGWAFIRSPRSMVRFAISPIPRPGICVTMNDGGRESCTVDNEELLEDKKAGNLAILAAMEGLVRNEMPRFSEKLEAVKTQKEVPFLEEHVGSISQSSVRSGDGSVRRLIKRGPEWL